MKRIFLIIPLLALLAFDFKTPVSTENEWKLTSNKNGIKVFFRKIEGRNLNELKMQMVYNCSLSMFVSAIGDVDKYSKWVYATTDSKTLKKTNNREFIYWDLVDFPWPLNNRDVIIEAKVTQNPNSKVVVVNSNSKWDMIPEKKDVIRIKLYNSSWTLTPLKDGKILAEHILSSDPGGVLPDAAINLALDTGPVKTLQTLNKMINDNQFVNKNEAKIID